MIKIAAFPKCWINEISEGKISAETAMIIVAFFVIAYTLLAGMISVAYMDIINGILIISGVFIAIPFLIKQVGGFEYIAQHVTPRKHSFLGNMTWIQAMGYFVPTLLLALGNGNMYQRFFSACYTPNFQILTTHDTPISFSLAGLIKKKPTFFKVIITSAARQSW